MQHKVLFAEPCNGDKVLKAAAFFVITAVMAGINFIAINVTKLLGGDNSDDDIEIYAMLMLICSIPSFLFIICVIIDNDEKKIIMPVYSNVHLT